METEVAGDQNPSFALSCVLATLSCRPFGIPSITPNKVRLSSLILNVGRNQGRVTPRMDQELAVFSAKLPGSFAVDYLSRRVSLALSELALMLAAQVPSYGTAANCRCSPEIRFSDPI